MKPVYDVVVVGAGPAGSVAALRAAQAGLDVLLLEKRQEIGVPVRCGEATDIETTREFMDIDPRWVCAHINRYAIHSAAGDYLTVPPSAPTITVDRRLFDAALAQQAAQAGAALVVNAPVIGLLRDNGAVAGVRVKHLGRSFDVRARLVVAADGVESQVARWAGLKTISPLADYYVGAQLTLTGMKAHIEPGMNEYHVGMDSVAPGGYVWVFPKGEDVANVGVVLTANRAHPTSARSWLEAFVRRRYPGAGVLSAAAGGIPVTGALKRMVTDGLLAVGDAAHQADPLTGGGIGLGMLGADMAMQTAIPAIRNGSTSARALSGYESLWQARFGKMHAALYAVRKTLTRMSEGDFNRLIAHAARLPLETMSHQKIVEQLLKAHPALLVQARTLVITGLLLK